MGMSFPYHYGLYAFGSSGMWCGILFGISGTFGIWAGCHPSKCTIIAHMVFAIISACICIPLTIGSVLFALVISEQYTSDSKADITLWMFIGLAVVGLVQAVLSLTTSALSCSVICCHTKSANEGGTITSSEWKPKLLPISGKPVVWMSVIQIIISILAIVLNIVGIIYPYHGIAYGGIAFWCAIPFVLCGAFGIWSGLSPSKCSVITFMVFTIISTCFSLLFLGISIVGFASSAEATSLYSNDDHYSDPYGNPYPWNENNNVNWNWNLNGSASILPVSKKPYYQSGGSYWNSYYNGREYERKVTFGIFLAQTLIGLTQLMISINSSAMACQPICCPTRNTKAFTKNDKIERVHQINQINPIKMYTEDFNPRAIPVASSIPAKPFSYQSPKDLVYLSATNASLSGHLKVQSTSNTPDIY
jgi:hypothetical protein